MKKQTVKITSAPEPAGPYSNAVRYGNLLFVSGQVSDDPVTGKTLHGSVGYQTRNALNNMNAILEEAGSSTAEIIKCTVYLSDGGHFAEMNAAYSEFFKKEDGYPARICTYGARIYDGLDVEIDCIAGIED